MSGILVEGPNYRRFDILRISSCQNSSAATSIQQESREALQEIIIDANIPAIPLISSHVLLLQANAGIPDLP